METLADDLVVLLDEHDRPAGTAPRATVHTTRTPLHLAFSCYLLDADGRVLLTRRAVTKRTWPGVWTNSFCGHPRPGEEVAHAVERRAQDELGISVRDVRCLLPDFRYRAVDPGGMVENELCPVYAATFDGEISPAPDEVAELRWATQDELSRAVTAAPWALSPWLVSQLAQLERSGAWPLGSG
ncbi:isopentenyl-diphosphate delta-isomerase [Xylanimonas oleitrophica]|uniref:Isopentenyl-diphosphate Delta-isomerase n=1 Tax=Xylanimonas oleitrophica TaxID=2607479 RepID=A0A2W5WS43_9MICO|nr:isopentenyl-diphosphate Delta-isomerase [Xylanimonas oleitrophica]PZR54167.1 isopentenyl-diphosphate delta-isomerase [Xylanimonas oleitrophica]